MSRMLLLVPRMYSEKEFKGLVSLMPDDFKARSSEFWGYVEEKLQIFMGRTHRVYRDGIVRGGVEGLAFLCSEHGENFLIVKKLVENGAVLEVTEDSMLVAESGSWAEAIKQNPLDSISHEMYEETLRERDRYVSKRIDDTLRDEETGVLFMKPGRTVGLNPQIKIVKVCRFEPEDYLRSWQATLKTKTQPS